MTNNDIHICCKVVLEFLLDDTKTLNRNIGDLPTLKKLNITLHKYYENNSLTHFTEYLNEKFNMNDVLIQDDSYRKWFRENAVNFYKKIINKTSREKKIERILENAKD
jgi:signal transduction histidine kinase